MKYERSPGLSGGAHLGALRCGHWQRCFYMCPGANLVGQVELHYNAGCASMGFGWDLC